MANKKHARKLNKVGGGTYSVTLPIEAIRELKWKEKQNVELSLKGKTMVIVDWKKNSKTKGAVARKLHKVGGGTYTVTLPIEAIRELKWKVGQRVSIEMKGKSLVIADWKE